MKYLVWLFVGVFVLNRVLEGMVDNSEQIEFFVKNILPIIMIIGLVFFIRNFSKRWKNRKRLNKSIVTNEDGFEDIKLKVFEDVQPDFKSFFKGSYWRKREESPFGVIRRMGEVVRVYMVYSDSNGNKSRRLVDVFAFKTYEGTAYLYGFCHVAGEQRTFKISQIRCLVLSENNKCINKYEIKQRIKDIFIPLILEEKNKKIVENCFDWED